MKITADLDKLEEVVATAPAEVQLRSTASVDWRLKTMHSFEATVDEAAKRALLDIFYEMERDSDGGSKISESTRCKYNSMLLGMHSHMRARDQAPQIVVKMDASAFERHQQAKIEAQQRALGAPKQP